MTYISPQKNYSLLTYCKSYPHSITLVEIRASLTHHSSAITRDSIINAANIGDSKRLFDIVKELTGHRMQRTHIKLANGKFAKTHDEEMKRWRVHFQEVLNCPEPSKSLNEEQLHNSLDVSMQDISQNEVIRATKKFVKWQGSRS